MVMADRIIATATTVVDMATDTATIGAKRVS
jgi:hypothetical protein